MPLAYADETGNFYTDNWYDHPSQSQLYGLGAFGFSLKPPKVIRRIVTPPPAVRKIEQKIVSGVKQVHMPKALTQTTVGRYVTKKSHEIERAAGGLAKRGSDWIKQHTRMTPLHKALAWFSVGNIFGGYQVIKAHPQEVINELPPYVRSFLNQFQRDVDDIFSGKKDDAGIHGFSNLGYFGSGFGAFGSDVYGSMEGLDGLSFGEMIRKIRQSWDHLPKSKKNLIIATLIVLVIVTIVIIIYASPTVQGWLKIAGDILLKVWEGLVKIFGKEGAWGLIMSLFGWIMSKFKGHSETPAEVATEPTPEPPVSPPTEDELRALGKSGKITGTHLTIGAAAAALLLL